MNVADAVPLASVLISDRQHLPLDLDVLAVLAADTIAAEGVGVSELSLSFVEPDEMEALHLRYMDLPGPTDVLAFPQDADTTEADGARVLGDVVICPAVAAENDPSDPTAELRLLTVHGVLHLLGYDHEEETERAEMWARQERYSGVAAP